MTPAERKRAEDLYNLIYVHTVVKYNPEAGIRCCAESLASRDRTIGELVGALARVMPIRINETLDYAEMYFADGSAHSTQAMTMNPQDWLDIEAAYNAANPLPPSGEK